jgi:hypothetical protein
MIVQFGKEYQAYKEIVPAFIPHRQSMKKMVPSPAIQKDTSV